MKYLNGKLLVASLLVLGSFTQSTIDPTNSSWGWDDYKQLKCDDGYDRVLNYCVKCDTGSGKVFDSVTKQCRTCPEGSTYNATNKSCDCECKPPREINPTTQKCECSGGKFYISKQCVCPESKPLWNGKKCVVCPQNTIFEPKDQQCYVCPEGFAVDLSTHVCSPQPSV